MNPIDLIIDGILWLVRRWRIRCKIREANEGWFRATYGRGAN